MAVYLIHLDKPFRHARHYLGYSQGLDSIKYRLAHHKSGSGANLLKHVANAGIGFQIVRVWPNGSKSDERRLKSHSSTRLCPICNPDSFWMNGNKVGTTYQQGVLTI